MKKRIMIVVAFIHAFSVTHSEQQTLNLALHSSSFFSLQSTIDKKTAVETYNASTLVPFLQDTKSEPLFCIIVGEPSKINAIIDTQETLAILYTFAKKLIFPFPFISATETHNPTFLFFNWDDKENNKKQKMTGEILADGIKSLSNKYPQGHFVIIGYGLACNVINYATNQLKKNKKVTDKKIIDLIVQLAPAIAKESIPNTSLVKNTIVFYTKKDHTSRNAQKYDKFYTHEHFPLIMHVLLFINNKHPEVDVLLSPFVAKHLLKICQELLKGSCPFYLITEMKKQGIIFHHRAHLSTMRQSTHMKLLAIPLENNNPKKIQDSLSTIGKNTLLNKCIQLIQEEEIVHKKEWGSYPLATISDTTIQPKPATIVAKNKPTVSSSKKLSCKLT